MNNDNKPITNEEYAELIADAVASRIKEDESRIFFRHAGEFLYSKTYQDMTRELMYGPDLPLPTDMDEYKKVLKAKLLNPKNSGFIDRCRKTGNIIPATITLFYNDISEILKNKMPTNLNDLLDAMECLSLEDKVAEQLEIDYYDLDVELADYLTHYLEEYPEKNRHIIETLQDVIEKDRYDAIDHQERWDEEDLTFTIMSCAVAESANDFLANVLKLNDDTFLVLGTGTHSQRLSDSKLVQENEPVGIESLKYALDIDSENNIVISYREGDHMLKGTRYSPDEPTGADFDIVPMSWINEYIKEPYAKKNVIKAMYDDDETKESIIEACPSIESDFFELTAGYEDHGQEKNSINELESPKEVAEMLLKKDVQDVTNPDVIINAIDILQNRLKQIKNSISENKGRDN